MDINLPYRWDDRNLAYRDSILISNLVKELIPLLTKELNNIHTLELPSRSYHLMLGYWLNSFVSVTFDRYYNCLHDSRNELSLDHNLFDQLTSFVPLDSCEANLSFSSTEWNHFFINTLKYPQKFIDYYFNCQSPVNTMRDPTSSMPFISIVKRNFLRILVKYDLFSSCTRKYVFSGSSLSVCKLLQLRLLLRGKIFYEPDCDVTTTYLFNPNIRKWKIPVTSFDTEFTRLVKLLIPLWMPQVFLENFRFVISRLNHQVHVNLSANDVIFSACNHFTNDGFKIWAGLHLSNKVKFVIGQHGGGPFHKFNGAGKFEQDVCDFFFTTGSGNLISNKIINVGQFFSRFKYGSWNPKGNILLVTVALPLYSSDLRSMPLGYNQINSYYQDLFLFYSLLPNTIQQRTNVRLYKAGDYGWSLFEKWQSRFPDVILDTCIKPLHVAASKSKIFVSTYNATTFNESLAANIPTIVFWNSSHWQWRSYSDIDFIQLNHVGIFHFDVSSAVNHIIKNWDHISAWWFSKPVQIARSSYCKKYAHRNIMTMHKFSQSLSSTDC